MEIGDTVNRVYRESFPRDDSIHTVERFSPDGTKVVLRQYRSGRAVGKAVTVKVGNIKPSRPTSGTFNGMYYEVK